MQVPGSATAQAQDILLVPGEPLWQWLCRVRLAADVLTPPFPIDPRKS
jgi:hypothetical protein